MGIEYSLGKAYASLERVFLCLPVLDPRKLTGLRPIIPSSLLDTELAGLTPLIFESNCHH